jgi:hypothetical protein
VGPNDAGRQKDGGTCKRSRSGLCATLSRRDFLVHATRYTLLRDIGVSIRPLSLHPPTTLTHTALNNMARGIEGNEIATPRTAPKKTGGSTQKSGAKQQSIAGFFKRTPGPAPSGLASQPKPPSFNTALKEPPSSADATPVPSSLPVPSSSPQPMLDSSQSGPTNLSRNKENGEGHNTSRYRLVADSLNRTPRFPPVQPIAQDEEKGQLR